MKINFKSALLLACLMVFASGCAVDSANNIYQVIPLPDQITIKSGRPFVLNSNTPIVYPEGNEKLKRTAELLSDYVQFSTGYPLQVTTTRGDVPSIMLSSSGAVENPEAYRLKVERNAISIEGASEAGTFYGVQTLRKSLPVTASAAEVELPAVEITDAPRFGYRGMHLDVARHMFPTEFVKKYIDILALHNINRLHWHITDDQGWRIEIKKYPLLTQIGAHRKQTLVGSLYVLPHKFDGEPYGGYYTQDEIRDIVAYAQDRNITIIPEVDLPGHMLAALTTFPELGCTGGPYEVATTWGIFEDILCAGNPKTYEFLENVFAEVIELFPSKLIHIGGDEAPKKRWEQCPKCQAKIRELGLVDDGKHSPEQQLQSYMMQHVEHYLNDHGRQVMGWDEILEGGLGPNTTVMSWRGTEGGIEAARQHHEAVMVPHYSLYFDYYQSEDISKEPVSIGGYIPVDAVYSYEPVPEALSPEEQKYIIGLQANLWTEYIASGEHAEYMVLPRMAALSEVQWMKADRKNYDSFLARLGKLFDIYEKSGYNPAKHVYGVHSSIEPKADASGLDITLSTIGHDPIYYTLDGTQPTASSLMYAGPITVDADAQLNAVAVHPDTTSGVYSRDFIFNKATLRNVELLTEPNPRYVSGGSPILVDGNFGANAYSDPSWMGFGGIGMIAVVDLEKSSEVSSVKVGTCIDPNEWIFGATELKVEVSSDGEQYREVAVKEIPVVDEGTLREVVRHSVEFDPSAGRYVKVSLLNTREMPEWHPGKGTPALLFIDEIEIK